MSDGPDRPRRDDPGYRDDVDYAPTVSYGAGPPAPKDDLALTALIAGIVSLAFGIVGLGLLASPVAVVLGLVSMRRIDRSEGRMTGRGQAKAGFVLGVIGCVLLVVLVAVVVGSLLISG